MIRSNKHVHKIALYVRVSTEEQAQSPEGSIKNQEERLKRAVKEKLEDGNNAEIVGVFVDPGRSGKDTNRPELQKMLTAIRRKEINLVMVTELSRLSRNTKDFCEMWEFFQEHDCEFNSLREKFDTTNAAGEMMLHMMMNFAQFERRQTAERISASFRDRAERGLYNGGSIPLGYLPDENKTGRLKIDPDEAELVRTAFKAFLDKGTLSLAARWLNDNGYRIHQKARPGGRPRISHFMHATLHGVLRNKSYVGVRVYKTTEGKKEVKAAWPAIIDEVMFNRVQELLNKNYKRKKPDRENRYPYLLTGLIYCGVCGDRLCGKSAWGKRKKIPYYEHAWMTKKHQELSVKNNSCRPHRIPGTLAEEVVWSAVKNVLSRPQTALELIEEVKVIHSKNSDRDEFGRIKKKIQGVSAQMDVLAERLAELPKDVPAIPIYKQMQKLEATKREFEDMLDKTKKKDLAGEIPVELSTYEEFLEMIRSWGKVEVLPPELKRRIISKMIDRIEIFPNEVKINFLMGQSKIERELEGAGSLSQNLSKSKTKPLSKYFSVGCSNTLTSGGDDKDRTCDLLHAMQTLSQLSYTPRNLIWTI